MNNREIMEALESEGLLEYGSFITGEKIREISGIDLPEFGSMEDFKSSALRELSITDYIRGQLIKKGRYLAAVKGDYRVLMPSENDNQVRAYMKSADNKLKRGIRLHDNTPKDYSDSRVKVRLHARSEAVRKSKESREFLDR